MPDMMMMSGDVFDSRYVKLDSKSAKLVFEIIQEIANLVPVAIVAGTPSHDGMTVEALRYIKAKYPVWVSTVPQQVYLTPSGKFTTTPPYPPELVISLVPPPTKQYFQSMSDIDSTNQEISAAMTAMFAGFGARAAEFNCPHILAGHLSIGGAFVSDTQQLIGVDIEVSTDQLALANAVVNMLGHIHFAQQIGDKTFYAGDLYRMDTGETEDKGFWLHELSSSGLQNSTFIKTPTRKLYKLKYDFTNSQNDFQIPFSHEMLDKIKDAIVTIELKVFEDEVSKIDQQNLELNLAEAKEYGDPKIIRVPRTNIRSERLLKLRTLREKIIEQARLRGEEVPESILLKADNLGSMTADEVVAMVAK
jgi:DNA repair exonuclease SbcCD nuclease subunit